MKQPVLINGRQASALPVTDRGLQYGDGLFETMAVFDGRCPWFDRHYERLVTSCDRLAINPPEKALLFAEVSQLAGGQTRAVIKIIHTRGSGGRGYRTPAQSAQTSRIVMRFPWPAYPAAYWREGIRLFPCRTRLGCNPALAGLKHLNRLEQVIARQEWTDDDFAEGLMSNHEGYVVEGIMSNVFWRRDAVLYTPDLQQCGVEGVMRRWVLARAKKQGVEVRVCSETEAALQRADELFLSNSLIGLWPVKEFAGVRYPVGTLCQSLLHELVETYPVTNA